MNEPLFVITATPKEIWKTCSSGMVAMMKEDQSSNPFIPGQDRDLLGARACIRCRGYIERRTVVIDASKSLVRCVNCGRLYKQLNGHLEKYPSDKREWDEIEIKDGKANGKGNGNGSGERPGSN